jgi:hypothetical protein
MAALYPFWRRLTANDGAGDVRERIRGARVATESEDLPVPLKAAGRPDALVTRWWLFLGRQRALSTV